MKFHIMTLFPQIIQAYMNESIMKRADEKGNISYKAWNIRDYADNKHKKVDDYPYGGGAGMVMTPQPIMSCYNAIIDELQSEPEFEGYKVKPKVIYLSPKGKMFNNDMAISLSKEESLVFLCGHYEGVDQRIIELIIDEEISIGDYVLTGGELPALVLIDSISRHVKGVLGDEESLDEESFTNGLLEYPQYTRPEVFMDKEVPKVLLSGHHKNINTWRKLESVKLTIKRRPDLFDYKSLDEADKKLLTKYNIVDK